MILGEGGINGLNEILEWMSSVDGQFKLLMGPFTPSVGVNAARTLR